MINFFAENYLLIGEKLLEHLYISVVSLAMGIVVAVPLGILLSKYEKISNGVMGVASVLQTIPSFALLALMIPVFGVGKKTAIAALFIYSLLPILRNTFLGLTSVTPSAVDAAKGMGMEERQILTKVKIPLALPVIMSGIRLSAVYVLAWTTLAAYVGAGGLGDFIFNGLNNYVPPMIFWGTIPITALALLTDHLFGRLEKRLSPYKGGE
ncbi:MAG: ABC transporter permease [Peptoniphilaceae bacterium]|nr:ABC transporter permease [Peptoniphilaceae bacterium]